VGWERIAVNDTAFLKLALIWMGTTWILDAQQEGFWIGWLSNWLEIANDSFSTQ